MTTTTIKPLISGAQVWTCGDDDEAVLRHETTLSEVSPEGGKSIVERVAAEFGPVVVRSDELGLTNGASGGFSALLGIPFITSRKVIACLVLAVNCAEQAMGAFEIWKRDDRDELGLNGAVFAGLSRFASISQHVRFPRGSGLPGQSWEDSESKMLTGLGTSPNFMRASGARAGGLDVGVALPIFTTEHDLNSVVLLLSSMGTPIAQVFEIWSLDGEEATLRKAASSGEKATLVEANEMTYVRGEGIVGKVWETGKPFLTDDLAAVERKRLASMSADGLTSAIALPIFVGDRTESVFVMLN